MAKNLRGWPIFDTSFVTVSPSLYNLSRCSLWPCVAATGCSGGKDPAAGVARWGWRPVAARPPSSLAVHDGVAVVRAWPARGARQQTPPAERYRPAPPLPTAPPRPAAASRRLLLALAGLPAPAGPKQKCRRAGPRRSEARHALRGANSVVELVAHPRATRPRPCARLSACRREFVRTFCAAP